MDEYQAKAVRELAKTGHKTLEVTENLAVFVGRVLGTLPEDAVGMLGGDWLHHVRLRNAARLQERTDAILRARGIRETSSISPRLAVPLLFAASDESEDILQDLWARLVANAMDSTHPHPVRRSFITTLQQLEPLDAIVLQDIFEKGGGVKKFTIEPENYADELGATLDVLEIVFGNLIVMGCCQEVSRTTYQDGKETRSLTLNPFGRELMRACKR